MEQSVEQDAKYQKLASEYSKVRSHASVLKKALLEEQAKSIDLKETIRKSEQTIRKHDQEMESLTFRNDQLTKRIAVLQHELQLYDVAKKGKNKSVDNMNQADLGVLNEELQKKIIQNAQLMSSMSDKDYELTEYKERIAMLEAKNGVILHELKLKEQNYHQEINTLKGDKLKVSTQNLVQRVPENDTHWKEEAEKWRLECEQLRSKPESNSQLMQYYETQIKEMSHKKDYAISECKALWAENVAITARLEHLTETNKALSTTLEESNSELLTTIENYKGQLDAMTEHLASQNDKITQQCDEVQVLKHKLASKK